ncbi:MAG TPA: NAD(P)H-dependent glycerol-3-phosphate dehydrogenase [Candidatus Limnocylindria bacterium]|nr:NAD(P)H-dependent glycerol-3-phosphate dehydrogenase [Candidatus Limnocylindria bacterium]
MSGRVETGDARHAPVAVLGAGSWGTALAMHLGRVGVPVRLWARDPGLAAAMRARRENPRYLPGTAVPDGVSVTADAREALAGSGTVLIAVPSHFVEAVLSGVGDHVAAGAVLVSATKGLEPRRGLRMSELLVQRLPGRPVAVLSGPSFAREVAQGRPTALVIASSSEAIAADLQRRLAGPALRLYTNRDVVGVELGGAVKNVMAIATGLVDGLGLGENARAALITRGLAEIVRLGVAAGAQPATFAGLAGLGDLVLTCTGTQSRNRALGGEIARGRALAEVEAGTPMVAEGVRTVASVLAMARGRGVTMPICEEVSAVLFAGKPVAESLASLLAREPRPEEEGASRA